MNSKRKPTPEQEKQRIDGLRILARIIARHYLDNPHLYHKDAAGDGPASSVAGPETVEGRTSRREGVA